MAFDIGTLVALLLTLAIFSYIYKETLIFRLAEHMFLGLATGHGMVTAYKYIVDNAWTPMLKGELTMIVGFIFGIMILFFLSKETEWISKEICGTWFPDAFIGSILNLMDPKLKEEQMDCTVSDAYETMACVEAAYQSNRSSPIPAN